MTACKICETRRPRRFCPAVEGDICPICCGTEREESLSCPSSCEYLREARLREKPNELPADFTNKEIQITDDFVQANEALLVFLSVSLATVFRLKPEMIDDDVREGLEAMILKYRAKEGGLVYEAKPVNALAAFLGEQLEESVADFGKRVKEATGASVRDATVLGLLVFLQRMEIYRRNGRKKGRAFIDFVCNGFPGKAAEIEA